VIEGSRIFPPFPKREIEFGNRWSANFQLDVVPGRATTVPRVQLDDLNVTPVVGVISATVTEIDSPEERNITITMRGMTHEDHLLMVRSSSPHSLI
jgi:hypothetical protein